MISTLRRTPHRGRSLRRLFDHAHLATCIVLCVCLTHPAIAQEVFQPSAEQMQMLNQLPPEQRQQAMDALREFQNKQRAQQQQSGRPGGEQQDTGRQADALSPEPGDLAAGLTQEPFIPKAEGGTSLVVTLTPKVSLTQEQLAEIDSDRALSEIRGSHYYELDPSGILLLPGLADIPLLGLTAGAIEQRLGAEPALAPFDVTVSILRAESMGAAALEPFGYSIFEMPMAEFEPADLGPVPPDFVLGPGDVVRVQLFGNVNGTYELEVSRDGTLNLPELGPMTVAGLQFSEFRSEIDKRVQQMLIGTQVSVTLGALRTIRVFVVGDVNRPGSYVVSSLATISSALYRSGGISKVGTLRDVQLKRGGDLVARLDLYDLLLNGDTSGDAQLQQGDVIFVPPIGTTIGVGGQVRRPAIYETTGPTTLAAAIRLAGGLSPEAFPEGATLQRIGSDRERNVLSVDLSGEAGTAMAVQSGDTLMVPRVLPELTDTVMLEGHVHRPGPYEWRPGMRLTDLVASLRALKPSADTNYLLVRRLVGTDTQVETFSADLEKALAAPDSRENIKLEPRDKVYVFNLAFGRQRIIRPILEELKLQATYASPYEEVRIAGRVRAPGSYPLHPGMRVSDLIRAGGNLAEGAYTEVAELTRFTVVDGEVRHKEILPVDLRAVLRGDPEADYVLASYDHLNISAVPNWNSDWSVTIEGEVRFPGEYQILRGETLSDLMERAGGLTAEAYPEGAIFLREELKEREQEQIDILVRRMETDLTSMSLESLDSTGTEALSVGQSLLAQLRATEPVGRMVIDLEEITNGKVAEVQAHDIRLKNNDRLLIPSRPQSVTVVGEAQYPASHLYSAGLNRDDYISQSGGLTRRADKALIYVVRASGAVISDNRSHWFGRGEETEMRPGDTIVIPVETDRIRPLTFWTNVSQIFYQTAIAVAAIRTFDN